MIEKKKSLNIEVKWIISFEWQQEYRQVPIIKIYYDLIKTVLLFQYLSPVVAV